jgi:hypothetical protein
MTAMWKITSPRDEVHAAFKNLDDVRAFLRRNGISQKDDKGWRVVEELAGARAECSAAFLLSEQGSHRRSILWGVAGLR